MQRLACETDDAEAPAPAGLAARLGPVERGALRIGVDDDDRLAALGQFAGQVRGERGLADAALLVEQGDDHGRVASRLRKRMSHGLGTTMARGPGCPLDRHVRSEEHTSELQYLMCSSYAVF